MNVRIITATIFAATLASITGANAQNRTITVGGSVGNGAVAGMAQMGRFDTSAGGMGRQVNTSSTVTKYAGTDYKGTFASSFANAKKGSVMSGTSMRLGTASAGASGLGVSASTYGSKFTGSDGTTQSLGANAFAREGGAYSAVTGKGFNSLSVGAGTNVSTSSGVSTMSAPKPYYGGGKG